MTPPDLSALRTEIDDLDHRILELLNKRAATALRIAQVKQNQNIPTYDPEREKMLLNSLAQANLGPLPEKAVRRVFGEIISACRAVQEEPKVSFLGPEATFTHMAAIQYFGRSCEFLPRGTIADVFREVERGLADFGVVPAENSIEGSVGTTLDEWHQSDVKICGEVLLPISHALLSKEKELHQIERVYSHPQALAQCRAWLSRNLPGVMLVEAASTAAAGGIAAREKGAAAVASELVADWHGLNVLAQNIQDRSLNLTRFFILNEKDRALSGQDKTSVLLATTHQPGALHLALSPLSEAGINMTRIESRPRPNHPWSYVFFIDFEGHHHDPKVAAALSEVVNQVEQFKILGSYPAAASPGQGAAADGGPAAIRLVAKATGTS